MDKRVLSDLIGHTIEHKKLGPCEVLEVTSNEECKFVGKVLATGEVKKLIFSDQFFNNVDEYLTADVVVAKKATTQRVHKKVDLDKYRNHPLVKKIDQQEAGFRARQLYEDEPEIEVEDEEDTVEQEEMLI